MMTCGSRYPRAVESHVTRQLHQSFSDHMVIASFHPAPQWSPPEIKPYGPLTLDPASSCFQYGGNIFEGLKVHRLAPLWWVLDGRRVRPALDLMAKRACFALI